MLGRIRPKIVQERLGHATIAVTLDTYSHVLPGLQEAAALRFEEGLAKSVLTARLHIVDGGGATFRESLCTS